MAHRDDVSLAHEEVRLAERNAAIHELHGSRHDEETGLVLFELGPLMGLAGVLDRERVQIELGLHLVEDFGVGLMQSNPDHMAGALRPLTRLWEADFSNSAAVQVCACRNHAEVFVGGSASVGMSHHGTAGMETRSWQT